MPAVFGYNGLFHALTVVAVTCQYVAIAFFVMASGSGQPAGPAAGRLSPESR